MTWWMWCLVAIAVWSAGAGVFYDKPGPREDPVPSVIGAATWPVWIGPALMFALGQEVRRVIRRALDGIDAMGANRSAKKQAEDAGKPRTF